jgi:hypothetical protein
VMKLAFEMTNGRRECPQLGESGHSLADGFARQNPARLLLQLEQTADLTRSTVVAWVGPQPRR